MARIRSQGRNFVLSALAAAVPVMAQEATSWNSRLKDGLAAIHSGHYQQAVQILTVLAEESKSFPAADARRPESAIQKTFGPGDVSIAREEAGLAQAYLGERNYKEAESLIRRAIATGRAVLGDAHLGVAELFMVAARVQERLHRSSEANLYYRQALTIFRRSLPHNHPDRAEAERQYAQFSKSLGK